MSQSSVKRRKVSKNPDPPALTSSSSNNNKSKEAVVDLTVKPDLDGVHYLVLVKLQSDDPNDVVTALEKLHELIPVNTNFTNNEEGRDQWEKVKKDLISIGTPAMIILTMQKWTTNEKIQSECCYCLKKFMIHAQYGFGSLIVRCGGVEAIMTALKAYPKSIDVFDVDRGQWEGDGICVQGHGIATLARVFQLLIQMSSPPEPIIQAARRFVYELDGLQLIQETMKNFSEDVGLDGGLTLQGKCCWLLSSLSSRKEFHEVFIECQTVSSVATAFETLSKQTYEVGGFQVTVAKYFAKNFMRNIISE